MDQSFDICDDLPTDLCEKEQDLPIELNDKEQDVAIE